MDTNKQFKRVAFLAALAFGLPVAMAQTNVNDHDLTVRDMTSSTSTFSGSGSGPDSNAGPLVNTGPQTNPGHMASDRDMQKSDTKNMNDRSSMSNDNSSSSSVSGTSAGGTEAVEPGVTTSNSATSNPNTTTTTERTYHSESATTTPDTAAADTGTQNDMNEKPAIKSGSHWRHHHAAKKMDKSTSSAMTDMPADQQLSQYSFDQKSQFKDTLKSRLDTIENKIQDVKSNEKPVISSNANHDKTMHSQVVTLQKKHDLAQKKLDDIDRVSSNDWDKYRNQISSQIGDLERNVEKLQTASR